MANCIPVKGAVRSVICDLQRNNLEFIPNDLYDILLKYNGKSIQYIKKVYENKYDDIIDEYFDFLLEKEFIFFTDTPALFPGLSRRWSEPTRITNAIIDIGQEKKYDIFQVLSQLSNLQCKHLELRFFRLAKRREIDTIVTYLDRIESSILSIEVVLPFSPEFHESESTRLFSIYPRLTSLRQYNAESSRFCPPLFDKRGYIVFTEEEVIDEKGCGMIDSSFFAINLKLFTESLQFNSCLNRKISVDKDGYIKNCPSFTNNYGHISVIKLADVIENKDFRKVWNIDKDQIHVCKDCEFRHICTDCRAYLEDPDDPYSKPLKCGYNPYTAEWEEWSTHPLKQKGIKYYKFS